MQGKHGTEAWCLMICEELAQATVFGVGSLSPSSLGPVYNFAIVVNAAR